MRMSIYNDILIDLISGPMRVVSSMHLISLMSSVIFIKICKNPEVRVQKF